MLIGVRMTNTDFEILKKIETTGKPCYFSKTKMDHVMDLKLLELSEENEEGKIAKLNDHALKLSKSFNKVFGQHGLEESKEIFIVARNSLNHWTSDNEKLKDPIMTDLPEIQKTAFGQ